jgi:S1-C subfamily serine protease
LVRFGLILAAVIFFCGSGDVRAQSVNSVKCNIDFKNCLETIRSVCGSKYHIHSRGHHMGGLLADIIPGPIVWYTAVYSCGEISQSSPAPPKKAIPGNGPRGYGTGFYVSVAGHILTNAHVVRNCSAIHVVGDRIAKTPAVLKGVDTTNDLALLELPKPPSLVRPILPWRADVPLGGQVAVFGFPYFGTFTETGTFTRGDVTALAGIAGNSAHLQISAPVQPGNSGGPVSNEQGQVVGVVVGRLHALNVARNTGDLPQNVNFAIKSAQAISFLQVHGISVPTGTPDALRLSGPDLAAHLKAASVLVVCG